MMDQRGRTEWLVAARDALDAKAKPPGSLGGLEEWAIRLCALQRSLTPEGWPAATLIFAGDHGITKTHQVSAYPRVVTPAIFKAIARGQAASSVLSLAHDMKMLIVDVGVDADVSDVGDCLTNIVVKHAKVCPGTADLVAGPAMTRDQMEKAMQVGRDAVVELQEGGAMAVCLGELGIGNTTAAAALLAALSGMPPSQVTGKGTGLDEEGVANKAEAISAALARCDAPQLDPRTLLQEVGGLELAAMVGAIFEASHRRLAVLVDGFISGAAALVALRIDPSVEQALFCTHKSAEVGASVLLEALQQPTAAMDLQLRLGEATGAILGAPLLRSAAALMKMATLQEAMR